MHVHAWVNTFHGLVDCEEFALHFLNTCAKDMLMAYVLVRCNEYDFLLVDDRFCLLGLLDISNNSWWLFVCDYGNK